MSSRLPSILITGTPGTGKTSLCEAVCELVPGLVHINISDLVKQQELSLEYDEERQCHVIDEDRVGYVVVLL